VHQDVSGSLHMSVIIVWSFIISFILILVDASSLPTTEPAALKKEYEKLKKAFDDVIKERDVVKKECDAIKKKFDDARKELDDTSRTLADVIKANQGLVKDNEDLQKSRVASTKVIDDLQKQLQGRSTIYMSRGCDTLKS
jgi:chromosome segregation ATPase